MEPIVKVQVAHQPKGVIKVNGDCRLTFEETVYGAKHRLVMLVKNWNDPIFHGEYLGAFKIFMKRRVPITIILGADDGGKVPEFLSEAFADRARTKKKIRIMITDESVCKEYFDWNHPVKPQHPIIADSNISHVRFLDTSDSKNPVWWSSTSLNDEFGVGSIQARLDIIFGHPSTHRIM
ncbi:MAG: hypothetical protein KA028_01290 [Candidatus Pacebacteria bacterium]|nr:hypothetical protein [Candidatus Paceibacterota bacterium]MBP9851856.1 hypothetical protein [Candidatus Paceibacterota bacterium]